VSGRRISRREQERLFKRMGINLEEIQGVQEVRIVTSDKVLILKNPSVTMIKQQGQVMYQIAAEETVEEFREEEEFVPTEEDILLVAQQTGKSPDEAKKALVTVKGDLAQAILLLKG